MPRWSSLSISDTDPRMLKAYQMWNEGARQSFIGSACGMKSNNVGQRLRGWAARMGKPAPQKRIKGPQSRTTPGGEYRDAYTRDTVRLAYDLYQVGTSVSDIEERTGIPSLVVAHHVRRYSVQNSLPYAARRRPNEQVHGAGSLIGERVTRPAPHRPLDAALARRLLRTMPVTQVAAQLRAPYAAVAALLPAPAVPISRRAEGTTGRPSFTQSTRAHL